MSMLGGIARRNWAFRLSVVLNICVLLYMYAHLGPSSSWVEDAPTNWAGSLQGDAYGSVDVGIQKGNNVSFSSYAAPSSPTSSLSSVKNVIKDLKKQTTGKTNLNVSDSNLKGSKVELNYLKNQTMKPSPTSIPKMMSLEEAIPCYEKSSERRKAQRGDYWVLYNYVGMTRKVKCWESVTYTTHADYTYLDNLEPLLERWNAPISIALHAPGTDFSPTINAIKYLRNCANPKVTQLVTFHVFFGSKHIPKKIPEGDKVISEKYNCSLGPPWVDVALSKMYKTQKKLLYPVNVGRNVARESALTHYVFPSDIELYPNPNLTMKFLEMIRRRDQPALTSMNRKVFVLPIFEINEKSKPPENKTQLVKMLKDGSAILFHKRVCAICHNVPRSKEWQAAAETRDLHVFHVGKRTGSFIHWEPIFIGTNDDPFYDERLSWEGKSDKMPQGYALCVLNYDFLILNNAFLVHRPGIKIYKKDRDRELLASKTNYLISRVISPELKILYGTRAGCAV